MIRLGFTGPRTTEPSEAQKLFVREAFMELKPDEFHHGCCTGSDAYAHSVAREWFGESKRLVLHPPLKGEFEMEYTAWDYANCIWYPRKDYLTRDRDVVDCATIMRALAKDGTKLDTPGSGTWYTVRQAIKRGRRIDVCYPSGKVVKY